MKENIFWYYSSQTLKFSQEFQTTLRKVTHFALTVFLFNAFVDCGQIR